MPGTSARDIGAFVVGTGLGGLGTFLVFAMPWFAGAGMFLLCALLFPFACQFGLGTENNSGWPDSKCGDDAVHHGILSGLLPGTGFVVGCALCAGGYAVGWFSAGAAGISSDYSNTQKDSEKRNHKSHILGVMPNNSLDAGGGSMFRNLIRPAMLD
jgi:hypothetical protein